MSVTCVDVRAVGSWRVNALNWPAQGAAPSCPFLISQLIRAIYDLLTSGGVPEEDLITSAIAHNALAVQTEIYVLDRAVMALEFSQRTKLVVDVVSQYEAIMASYRTN